MIPKNEEFRLIVSAWGPEYRDRSGSKFDESEAGEEESEL